MTSHSVSIPARSSWVDLLDVSIDAESETPLFQQVYILLRDAILSHRLEPGSRLPPSRQFAERLGVSRTSVLSAYDQLATEGYTEGRKGSGTFVSQDIPEPPIARAVAQSSQKRRRQVDISQAGKNFLAVAKATRASDHRPFRTGCSSVDALTVENWRRVNFRHHKSLARLNLHYEQPAGLMELRQEVAQYLRAARSVTCEPEQIIIMSGAQQALDVTMRCLIDPGEAVWIEDPGYLGARIALQSVGARLVPVPVDNSGIVVARGIELGPAAKAAYVTPSHQYPTGAVMSMRRRTEILDWADQAGAWIIEDDYDSEFRYVGRPLSCLQGMRSDGRVIYIGTLSKMLFPGLRIGFAVVPRNLIDVFIGAKYAMDRQPPSLQQVVVADFIRSGYLLSHIRRIRQHYLAARDLVVDAVRRSMGDLVDVEPPECGLQLAIRFKDQTISDVMMAEKARDNGVTVTPFSTLFLSGKPQQGLLLGYSGFDPHELRQGVKKLASLLRREAGG